MELSYQQATQLHFEALREAGTIGSFPGALSLTQQEKLFHTSQGSTIAVYEGHGLAGLLSVLEADGELSAVTYLRHHHYSEYLIAILVNSIREVAAQEKKTFALNLPQREIRQGRTLSRIWPGCETVQRSGGFLSYSLGDSDLVPLDFKLVGFLEAIQPPGVPLTSLPDHTRP